MKAEEKLLLALEFVTEGMDAEVPQRLSRSTFSTESFLKATDKLKKTSRSWTQGSGIQGLGIGEKESCGKLGKKMALRVYVNKKKPLSKVKNPIPKKVRIPDLGVCTTDVLEIGKVEPEVFTQRVRPAMPGCGLAHSKVTVGTFGCLVKINGDTSGRLYILSNSHVLANQGVANVGDEIRQPGPKDGGRPSKDLIATLDNWVPFVFSATGYPNLVDAAIARVRRMTSVDNKIRILGIQPVGVSRTLRRGMRVKKVGRTTDYTIGEIRDINYRLALIYSRPGGGSGRAGLSDQVLCTRYTAGGDSGSVVLNNRNRVVGLHFAGSPSTSIFNRITHVFTALDIQLA